MAKVVASVTACLAMSGAVGKEMKIAADVAAVSSLVQEEQCIVTSTNFLPSMSNVSHTMQTSAEACQISCALTDGCVYFSYNKYLMQCKYADVSAKAEADYRFVSGRPTCRPGDGAPAVMCKTDYPKDGFPGLNAEQSNEAWPFGRQPKSLECWPKKPDGKAAQCKLTTVIEDTTDGWPGVCWGLQKKDGVTTTQCDDACRQDPNCASYQIEDDNCYMGLGRECYVRESAGDWKPSRAQRFQHGSVRVLMDLKGWQVKGLSKVFRSKADYFESHDDSAKHCKLACYSDIECQYWIYSTDYGCWVEDVTKFRVKYPLTTESMTRDSTFAQTAVAGEYVQHICEAPSNESLQLPGVPFCALSGYKLEPLDLTQASIVGSADQCQKKCFNTASCAYFSFVPKTGACHLEGVTAQMVIDADYISGPQDCPVTTPGPQASCDLHSQCVAEGFEGVCCPNQEGVVMECCGQTAVDTTPSRTVAIAQLPAAPADEEPWFYYWWPLFLAIVVVVGALGTWLFWVRRNHRMKRAFSTPEAFEMDKSHVTEAEALMDPFAGQLHALPFPEAGLPNAGLPFPEAGFPVHTNGPYNAHFASYA